MKKRFKAALQKPAGIFVLVTSFLAQILGKKSRYITSTEEIPWKLTENFVLPFSLGKITRTPYKIQSTVYTKEQAENKAAMQFKRYQKQLLEREIQIVDSDVSTIIDGVSCVTKGTLTVDEVCGKRQPAAPDPTPK